MCFKRIIDIIDVKDDQGISIHEHIHTYTLMSSYGLAYTPHVYIYASKCFLHGNAATCDFTTQVN